MHQRVSKGANGALKNSLKNLSWKSYIIIQNSDKGNPIVTVDRDKYIKTTQKFLIDQSKVQKMLLKDNDFLSLIISQEKFIDKMYAKIPDSNSMSDKRQRYLEPVGTRPIIIYGSCKVCKLCWWLFTFQTDFICFTNISIWAYKVSNAILEPLTSNEYTIKNSFDFATEIFHWGSGKLIDLRHRFTFY